MKTKGMTLLEVMFATAIMTVVMTALYGMALGLADTARVQEATTTAHDEARRGLLVISKELRQAAGFSLSGLPEAELSYRVATDVNGNGLAVDASAKLELSAARILTRDFEDMNGDGRSEDQLILIDGEVVRVLANGLMEDEDLNGTGWLDEGEDTNNNWRLDRGIWFEKWFGGSGNAIRINIQTAGTSRQGHILTASLSEVIIPRN